MTSKSGNIPSIPLECVLGREITRSFDFTNDKGEHISGQKSVVQISFNDCDNVPTIGVFLKQKGWDCDLSKYIGRRATLFCTSFKLDSSGMCVFRACGIDVAD